MKYTARIYAKALAEVIVAAKNASVQEQDKIVRHFIALVRKNGDEGHLRKLVEEAARLTRAKTGVQKVTIATARFLSPAQKKALQAFMKSEDVVEETVDPELVAGVKIVLNDELQFDGSLKGKLDKVFG